MANAVRDHLHATLVKITGLPNEEAYDALLELLELLQDEWAWWRSSGAWPSDLDKERRLYGGFLVALDLRIREAVRDVPLSMASDEDEQRQAGRGQISDIESHLKEWADMMRRIAERSEGIIH